MAVELFRPPALQCPRHQALPQVKVRASSENRGQLSSLQQPERGGTSSAQPYDINTALGKSPRPWASTRSLVVTRLQTSTQTPVVRQWTQTRLLVEVQVRHHHGFRWQLHRVAPHHHCVSSFTPSQSTWTSAPLFLSHLSTTYLLTMMGPT